MTPTVSSQPGFPEPMEPEEQENFLDRHKDYMDSRAQRAAQWIDSFFGDPNYEAEVANSQFRVRPELHYRDEQGAKGRLKFLMKLQLPNVEDKVSLFAGNTDEDDDFDQDIGDADEETVVGLQFFGRTRNKWHTSLSAGVKFNEFAGFIGPRARYYQALGDRSSWSFTQTVRWQTNNHWQFNSRLDLNHLLSERFFFRQTFDGRWRGETSEEEGYRTRVSSFLTQRLQRAAGLQYEFTTIFHTRPDTHVDRYTVALRYRKRTWRDWFYYEIAPELSFEDEYDYKANPGIRLRIEIFYGADRDDQFWKHEHEDTDDFRW